MLVVHAGWAAAPCRVMHVDWICRIVQVALAMWVVEVALVEQDRDETWPVQGHACGDLCGEVLCAALVVRLMCVA